jgi:hypothetical protein
MAGMRRTWIVGVLALALVSGCGDDDSQPRAAESTPAPTATATPEPVGDPPAAPPARTVRFEATDGEPVRGQYTAAGRDAPAVVLLHEIRGGPDQWAPLVPFLHEAGFATLAYQSRASPMESERLPDAIGALRWLRARPDVDAKRIALVGASIGASTAVLAMATDARRAADAAVALSPPDSSDIWALQDDDRYRPHDLLLIADEGESASAEGMLDGAVRSEFVQSAGPGHGVALLPERGVHDALLAWLGERVR